MKTMTQIRADLKAIRYFYSQKKVFDEAGAVVGVHQVADLAQRYNKVMLTASPWLFDLYIGLYVQNRSQQSFADERNFVPGYIQRENDKLVRFLQKNLEEGGEA